MEKHKTNRYLILGSGIAGMSAAEEIRRLDPSAVIQMVTEENEVCTNRPMLIMDLSLEGSGSSLFGEQDSFLRQLGIEIIRGASVSSIDRDGKEVHLSDGVTIEYDRLIYALGSAPMIPDIPGVDRDSVFSLRTRDDTRRIREAIKQSEHAVVIGGGMLGIETAWALYNERMPVTIIEQAQRLAFGQLDQSAGNLMKKRIERHGVTICLNARVEEIGDGYVAFHEEVQGIGCKGKECHDGVKIPAHMVIFSTGVTPNSSIGAEAGLEVTGMSRNEPGWIVVDENCRTSDPVIFAAGDVAAKGGRKDTVWDEARSMGRVAGANAALDMICSDSLEETPERPAFTGAISEHIFNGFDTELFTMGDSSGEETGDTFIRHADVEIFDYQRERYIRVSLCRNSIAGILLINASELVPDLTNAYHSGGGEEEVRQIIMEWKQNHEVDFKPADTLKRDSRTD